MAQRFAYAEIRDYLVPGLTPAQIEQAETLALDWKPPA